MRSIEADPVEREDRLAAALASCLEALDSGPPVDRAVLLARYPEFAADIARFLEDQEQVECRAAPLRAVAGLPTATKLGEDFSVPKELGDFRIVREVGRGGMGIVYEAEQLSLSRRVALKVLPFAATMDARYLQRFQNEARAAACLHHTNIVPVHFVGCERGVHFYAMQFIDGQPLSAIIVQMRRLEKKAPTAKEQATVAYRPSPEEAESTPFPAAERTPLTCEGRSGREYYRKVAELGIQAAEALDHAHQLGIVHRDIKPGNLLLDGRGNLWVTDFGLAHMQHSEASLTMTGDLVGTLRYMSPEQALAKRVVIDHRTDIYSLGVTLYELLTLQPAFRGKDRQELLQQVAFEEPAAPRRLNKAIPAELEIIVFKAMEKNPAERYSTAKEVADDLRHWLEDRPIRARRPSLLQLGRKWARRHQAAMRTASVLLPLLLVFGFGFALWWVQKRTEATTEVRTALEEAQRLQTEEKWSEALGALRRAQAVLRGFGSDAGLRQQVDELGKDLEMVQRLEDSRLLIPTEVTDEGFGSGTCIAAYVEAFAWYGLDVEHGDTDAVAEFIRSRSIQMQLVAALDFWASLLHPDQLINRQEMTHLLAVARAADSDAWRNRLRDAVERWDVKVIHDLLASSDVDKLLPTTLSLLKSSDGKYGTVFGVRVAALLRQAQQRRPADFWINQDLAVLLNLAEPPQQDTISYYRAALALRPQSAIVHVNLGDALTSKGQLDEAIGELRTAIRLKKDLAMAHYDLGNALRQKGQMDEAIGEYQEAIRIKRDYFKAHNNLGSILCDSKGDYDGAIVEWREAIRLQKDNAEAHDNLGHALHHKGQLDEAIAEFREAIRLKKAYSEAHNNLGVALRSNGRLDEAIAEFREAIRLKKDNAHAHNNLGAVLLAKGRFDEAIAECWEAIHLKQDFGDPHLNLGNALARAGRLVEAFAEYGEALRLNAKHARYNSACAAAYAGCGQGSYGDQFDAKERARLRQQALEWLRVDLKAYRHVMDNSSNKTHPAIAQQMQIWLQDEDFAGVRGDKALDKLPAEERAAWRKLWTDVAELLAKAQGISPAEKEPDMK